MTWHLLLDYDTPEAVPGSSEVERKPLVANPGGKVVAWDVDMVAIPAPGACRAEIARRLTRAGYAVAAFAFEPSTNGWHAKVELDRAPTGPLEVVALQAICGSDPLRESCNLERARAVQDMGAHAAGVLLRELDAMPAMPEVCRKPADILRVFLQTRISGPDSFWLDRWNVLYANNPNRRGT